MFQTYESNIAYVLRFMVDKDVRGGAWVEFPAKSYRIRSAAATVSHCQLEIDIHDWTTVIAHAPEGDWLKMAPLRVMSFDIECAGRKGFFPTADVDPVIQIANVVKEAGRDDTVVQNIFTLNTCASIVNSEVICHETEAELLMAWRNFLIAVDPDLITGYNIVNFDLPYIPTLFSLTQH
jgi:DNA polymerase delta subunit 1